MSNPKFPVLDGDPCGRNASEGDPEDKCLFHTEQEKDAQTVMDEFLKLVQKRGEDGVDATRYVFPEFRLKLEYEFPGPVNFRDVTFTKDAYFDHATFTKNAYFEVATFIEEVSFINATFTKDAFFYNTTFTKNADFGDATFAKDAYFINATFTKKAYFQVATFSSRVGFMDVNIGAKGRLDFQGCRFQSDALFQDLEFPTDTSMDGIDMRIDFRNVPIRGEANIIFQGVHAREDPAGAGRMDASKIRFAHTDVSRIRFHNLRWHSTPAWRTLGERVRGVRRRRVQVADEHYLRGFFGQRTHEPPPEDEQLHASLVANVYRGIRASYESSLRFQEAGEFHVREMELRRYALGHHDREIAPTWPEARQTMQGRLQYVWHRLREARFVVWWRQHASLLHAFGITSRYGQSPSRAGWWLAAWFLAFGAYQTWIMPMLPVGPWNPVHGWVLASIRFLPAQVGGDTVMDFIARLGGVFLVTILVVALRRTFRRSSKDGGN